VLDGGHPNRQENRMQISKNLSYAAVALSMFAGALTAQAQTDASGTAPKTRAEVKEDLKNVEKNGYQPTARDPYYPNDIQAAENASNAGGKSSAKMRHRKKTLDNTPAAAAQ
jgi:hypothetical protein